MAEEKSPSEVLSDLVHVPFPNTAYLESMKRVIATQKLMLDGFQTNLDKWFERRREGADTGGHFPTASRQARLHAENQHVGTRSEWRADLAQERQGY